MADGNTAVAKAILHLRGQFKKAKRICDHCPALADFGGDLFLGQLKLVDELGIALGFFKGVQILSLEILDKRQFKHGPIRGLPANHGNFGKSEHLGRAPPTLSGYELEMAIVFADNQGLNDTLFLDGVS
jgi:hypothetical protein